MEILTFTQNFGLDRTRAGGFSHAWSLCVEEHFYLVLPSLVFLACLARSWISSKYIAFALPISVFILGMVLRTILWLNFVAPAFADPDFKSLGSLFDRVIYYPSYNRLDGLLVGVVIALLFTFKPAINR